MKRRKSSPELLTVREAAEFLRVSRHTLYRWIEAGLVPSYRLRGTIRLAREDLLGVMRVPGGPRRVRVPEPTFSPAALRAIERRET